MFNATITKNMIEQDDRAVHGSLDHVRYCAAQDDRAETSIKRVTYEKLDHWQNLIEQSDREKTLLFDHDTAPLEGAGYDRAGRRVKNDPYIRRLGTDDSPPPVLLGMVYGITGGVSPKERRVIPRWVPEICITLTPKFQTRFVAGRCPFQRSCIGRGAAAGMVPLCRRSDPSAVSHWRHWGPIQSKSFCRSPARIAELLSSRPKDFST